MPFRIQPYHYHPRSLVILSPSKNMIFFPELIGEYSCLKVDLAFQRKFSYYLLTIYIPCDMLVVVSWVSFWLDANAIPARVSLGVTTLLTMATQTTGINNSLPPVSYTKVSSAIIKFFSIVMLFFFKAKSLILCLVLPSERI